MTIEQAREILGEREKSLGQSLYEFMKIAQEIDEKEKEESN